MKLTNKKGFTLIELMVVMAIIAVLAVLILGAVQLARNTSTETIHRSNAKGVQTALEANYAKNKRYCGTFGGTELPCGTIDVGFTAPVTTWALQGPALTSTSNLYNAYYTLTGTNLANAGSTVGQCVDSTKGGYGGGRILALTPQSYMIGVVNAGCTGYTGINDIIQANITPALPTTGTLPAIPVL